MHLHIIGKTIFENKEFAIVDVETTGGSPKDTRITDIAIFISNGEEIVADYQTLVNPGCNIPWFISNFTKITNEMVRGAPCFNDIAEEVINLLAGRCLIAHNVSFDYTVLKKPF